MKNEVRKMKKALAAAGALMLAYVIVTSSFGGAGESAETYGGATEASAAVYLMREVDGRVVVFKGDEVYLSTGTRASDLPKSDRERLARGIEIYSDEELKALVEDICS